MQIPSHGVGFRSFKVSEGLSEAIKPQNVRANVVPRSPTHQAPDEFPFSELQHKPTSDYAKNNGELANHLTQRIKNNVTQELQNSLQKK